MAGWNVAGWNALAMCKALEVCSLKQEVFVSSADFILKPIGWEG